MYTKSNRPIYVLVIISIIIPLLAACAGAGTPTAQQEATQGQQATSVPQPLIQKYAGETIRVLLYEQVPSYSTIELLPEFEAATGIKGGI